MVNISQLKRKRNKRLKAFLFDWTDSWLATSKLKLTFWRQRQKRVGWGKGGRNNLIMPRLIEYELSVRHQEIALSVISLTRQVPSHFQQLTSWELHNLSQVTNRSKHERRFAFLLCKEWSGCDKAMGDGQSRPSQQKAISTLCLRPAKERPWWRFWKGQYRTGRCWCLEHTRHFRK